MKQFKEIKIEFEVNRVTFRNDETGYSILDVKMINHPGNPPTAMHTVNVVSKNTIRRRDVLSGVGKWVDKGYHGYQFEARQVKFDIPSNLAGLKKFLVRHISGVGTKTAGLLIDEFGLDFIDIVTNEPEKLLDVVSVNIKEGICKDVLTLTILNDILEKYECLDEVEVSNMIKKCKEGSLMKLLELNPYFFSKEIGFKKCEEIASISKLEKNNPNRLTASILEALRMECSASHVYTDIEDIYTIACRLLNRSEFFKPVKLDREGNFVEMLDILIKRQEIVVEEGEVLSELDNLTDIISMGFKLVTKEKRVYLKEYHVMENGIVDILATMINIKDCKGKEKKIRKIIGDKKEKGLSIEKEQEDAILMALTSKVSILSGGPGTGKTYTLGIITDIIKTMDPYAEITLASPTGIAAKRMTESSGLKASTIHSLLKLSDEDVVEVTQVETDYIIIDESSMIDISIFYSLLKAVKTDTKLLFIGDHNQLPSVGAGLILRDLIDSKELNMTILTEIHRQARDSQIIKNARNIIEEKEELYEDNSKGDFFFIEQNSDIEIRTKIGMVVERLLETGFELNDIQLVSPLNQGDLSVEEFNNLMQEKYNKRKEEEKIRIGNRNIRVGDRVIHTKNNKDLDVYNGETGVVIDVKHGGMRELTVDFGDKKVTYSSESIYELQLSYALTVHKTQGSGFKVIIMPISTSRAHNFMLSKSLLYTALTRTEERIIFVGDKKQFFKSIKNTSDIIRRSKVKEKLIKAMNTSLAS